MSAEIPEGLTVETVWAVEGTYASDAAEKRPAVRPEHLARIDRLMAEGIMVAAGAFTDMSTSLLLIRAPSEAAALELAEQDVYRRSGVWTSVRARPFGLVVRDVDRGDAAPQRG